MSSRRWGQGTLLAGVASVVVLAVGGCGGGGGSGGQVASAGGKTSSGAAKQRSGELAEYIEAQRKWVKCMRGAGVDLPDPDSKGRVEVSDELRRQKEDPKVVRAQTKCADLNVPIPDSVEKEMQPAPTKAEISQRRRYAKCMQDNGAPDFPDVAEDGYYKEEGGWDESSAGAKRATRECGPIMGIPTNPPPAKG